MSRWLLALALLGALASVPPAASRHPCGMLERVDVSGVVLCTHGGDGGGLLGLPHVLTITPPPPRAPCLGDGQSGKRAQLFYGQVIGETDRSSSALPAIRGAADSVNQAWVQAGNEDVRWQCDPAAHVQTVTKILLAGRSLSAVITALRARGYSSTDRIYIVATYTSDGSGYSGFATLDADDRAANNSNDTGPAYSVIYGFNQAGTMMHELGHELGAVQGSAPHSSGAGHCYDESDVMCYSDGGPYFRNGGTIWNRCPQGTLAQEWDCGRDDYFASAPAAGSYLAAHWNTYRSSFLQDR